MARPGTTMLERAAAHAVTTIVDALEIASPDYRDTVVHEYGAIAMEVVPLVHDALVLGRPMTPRHLETMAQSLRHLAAGGVTLSTALTFTPVAMAHLCATGGAPAAGGAGPAPRRGVSAAEWVRRTTAYSQQASLVCLDVWGSAPPGTVSAVVADPMVPVPGPAPAGAAGVEAPLALAGEASAPLESTDVRMLLLVAEGRSNQQIASAMSYSSQAVRWRLARLMRRWHVANRAALVTVGFQTGVLRRAPRRADLTGAGAAQRSAGG